MNPFRRRSPDPEDFDVVVGRPTDDPDEVCAALRGAGVEARVVEPGDGGPAVAKIRRADVPGIQEVLERHLR